MGLGGIAMKTKKRSTLILLGCCVLCLALVFLYLALRGSSIRDARLRVTVLKVGKADAIFLRSGDAAMMIDTGEADDAEKIVQFLKDEGVTTLNAMIITHFDKDHVGSAGQLVEQFNVERVLVPDYEGTREEYFDFISAMKAAMVTPEPVAQTTEFTFGESSVLIEPPLDYSAEGVSKAVDDYDNTLSLITTVTCGQKKFLFAADADRRRLKEWLEHTDVGHVDFLKVPHHGLFNAALEPFLQATTPEFAAITCSKKKPADASVLELLEKYGVNVFQTAEGPVTAVTDGVKLEVRLN